MAKEEIIWDDEPDIIWDEPKKKVDVRPIPTFKMKRKEETEPTPTAVTPKPFGTRLMENLQSPYQGLAENVLPEFLSQSVVTKGLTKAPDAIFNAIASTAKMGSGAATSIPENIRQGQFGEAAANTAITGVAPFLGALQMSPAGSGLTVGTKAFEETFPDETAAVMRGMNPVTAITQPESKFGQVSAGAADVALQALVLKQMQKPNPFARTPKQVPAENFQGTAEQLGIKFDGFQDMRGKKYPQFTDPKTGTTFYKGESESVAQALQRKRNQFERPQVEKMIGILEEAKPIRKAQEKLYSERRKEQLPALSQAYKTASGEESVSRAKGVLKGELPKAQYESVRPKVTQEDVDFFFNEVAKTDKISDWDRLSAVEGLNKIFSKEGGSVPTKGEIAKLEQVFGNRFAEAVLNKEGGWNKFKREIPDIINLPRTLMSSFDMSMPLRQGIIQTVSHPVIAGKAFKDMHKAFVSPKAYEEMKFQLSQRPNAELYKDTKLHIPALEIEYKPKNLSVREDGFVSRFLQTTKIPVLKQVGAGVKMSERAALTYLSKIRADVFDMYAGELQKAGITPQKDAASYKALADWVNVSTGRGEYGAFERFAPTASALMFSPRLLKSRIDVLNPVTYLRMPKEVAVMAMKDVLKFGTAVAGLLTLAKIGGADVETDPRSTDFAKIKVGNTRLEVTGGIQPIVRFATQFATGQRKKFDGQILNMDNSSPYAGNRWENLLRFGEGKLNPHASLVVDVLRGQNYIGNDITFNDEVLSRITPLYLQDAYDAAVQEGMIKAASIAVPSFYGVGTNTYPPKPKPVFRAPSTKPPKL